MQLSIARPQWSCRARAHYRTWRHTHITRAATLSSKVTNYASRQQCWGYIKYVIGSWLLIMIEEQAIIKLKWLLVYMTFNWNSCHEAIFKAFWKLDGMCTDNSKIYVTFIFTHVTGCSCHGRYIGLTAFKNINVMRRLALRGALQSSLMEFAASFSTNAPQIAWSPDARHT